jgi:hypothetical protein
MNSPRNTSSNNLKFDFITCLISLILYVGVANAPFKAKPFGDLDFHIEAKTLAQYFWGNTSYENISITKAPGPVLFYTLPYFLAGPSATENQYWVAGVLWTGLFMTLAVILIRKTATNLGNPLAGRVAVIAILIMPIHLYYSLGILAEGLAFLGACAFIFGYSRIVVQRISSLSWICFAAGLIALILARPNALLILPILAVFLIWQVYIRKDQFFVKLRAQFFISIVAMLATIAFISVVVKNLPNKRKTFNQEGYLAYVAIIGRYQFRDETWDWRFWDKTTRPDSKDLIAYYDKLNEIRYDTASGRPLTDRYYDFLIADGLQHKVMAIKQFFVRTLFGHTLQVGSVKKEDFGIGAIRGPSVFWAFHIALNVINFTFIVTAILFLVKIRRTAIHKYLLIVIPWIALILFHGIVYMEQRYLFPARPLIIVLAALWIADRLVRFRFYKHLA